MKKQQWIDLVAASARLRIPWGTAYRWVLTGRLIGERRETRWFVDPESVRRVELERRRHPEPVATIRPKATAVER